MESPLLIRGKESDSSVILVGFWVVWQWNRIIGQDEVRDVELPKEIFSAHYGDLLERTTLNFIPSNQEGCCFDGLKRYLLR